MVLFVLKNTIIETCIVIKSTYAKEVDFMDVCSISIEDLINQVKKVYGFKGNIDIKLLKYSENINYKVTDCDNNKSYALRLCRPMYHKPEELDSEMCWISRIKEDTDVSVASPFAGADGKYVQRIELGNDGYYCSMFDFLKGVTLRDICDKDKLPEYIERLGNITAQFHKQVTEWDGSGNLNRFSWDYSDLMGKSARWGDWRDYKGLTEEEKDVYSKVEKIMERRLKEYGKNKENYGLIHTDLNLNNIIVNDGVCQVLDFDDCGFGWFLWDMGTTLLEYEDNLEEMLNAWLRGYESVRKLRPEDKAEIMTFIMLRKIVRIAWIGSHSDNDTVKKVSPSYYAHVLALGKRYIDTQSIDAFFHNV